MSTEARFGRVMPCFTTAASAAGERARRLLSRPAWPGRRSAFQPPPQPDQHRPDHRADRQGREDRRDRPLEERQDAAVGLDQRGDEGLLHHGAHHDPEHHGGDRIAVRLHDVADDAEGRDRHDAEQVVADRERADRAAQHDDRHDRGARRAQHIARQADHDDAERDHQDVGDDEHQVDRVHARRFLGEQRRAGIEPLHVEHADRDRRDGVAGNAEQQRRHPARGDAGIVAGAGLDQALDMAGAELFRLLREALRHRVADPGRHVGAGARQHADDDADDVAARHLPRDISWSASTGPP